MLNLVKITMSFNENILFKVTQFYINLTTKGKKKTLNIPYTLKRDIVALVVVVFFFIFFYFE